MFGTITELHFVNNVTYDVKISGTSKSPNFNNNNKLLMFSKTQNAKFYSDLENPTEFPCLSAVLLSLEASVYLPHQEPTCQPIPNFSIAYEEHIKSQIEA